MKTAGLNLTLHLSFHENGSLLANLTRSFIRSILCRDNSPPTSVNHKITTAIQSIILHLLIYDYEKAYRLLQI